MKPLSLRIWLALAVASARSFIALSTFWSSLLSTKSYRYNYLFMKRTKFLIEKEKKNHIASY